ncbi:hypothetical protein [Catelliglobosispora koreensis]|uniref:hypothetical protein n=1 Tax=Catelliglobosispora koreensis TaxID=129052 RepID=UPI0012FB1787|nr:hypothetical protein [Catelliglobosispora koreensis]
MRVRQDLPVLFLLLMVTAGLFTMHTTGHAGLAGATSVHVTFGHHQQLSGAVASHLTPLLPRADALTTPPAEHTPGTLMAICVAILSSALTAVVALFMLHRRSASTTRPHWQAAPRPGIGRGPPLSRIGLLIADLSVART